jgi:tRNA-splicing ligase RtcB
VQRTLNLKDEQEKLDSRGILHTIRGEQDLDEASGAYKDIDVVMGEQADLVKVLYKLEPLGVIKG